MMTCSPYSSYLLPYDFFLSPNIKNKMRGELFESPEAVVETFRILISEVTVSEWKKCFENWFERMQKCIDLKGEYFEKQAIYRILHVFFHIVCRSFSRSPITHYLTYTLSAYCNKEKLFHKAA